MRIEHHILEGCPPTKNITDQDGKKTPNPPYGTWLINDGLLTSWLLGVITEEILAMVEGTNLTHQVWSSLEETCLPTTKET